MPITHSTALKNARLAADVTALGAGAKLVLGTAALAGATGVIATIVLGAVAGTVAAGVLTITNLPASSAATVVGGTLAKAELRDSSDATVISGLTVGIAGSGADVIVGTTAINVGNVLTVNTAQITAA